MMKTGTKCTYVSPVESKIAGSKLKVRQRQSMELTQDFHGGKYVFAKPVDMESGETKIRRKYIEFKDN